MSPATTLREPLKQNLSSITKSGKELVNPANIVQVRSQMFSTHSSPSPCAKIELTCNHLLYHSDCLKTSLPLLCSQLTLHAYCFDQNQKGILSIWTFWVIFQMLKMGNNTSLPNPHNELLCFLQPWRQRKFAMNIH